MTTQAFLKKMTDDGFRTAFESAATPEAKAKVLAEAGLALSVEQAEAALAGEALSDDDLEKVSGGGAGVVRYPPSD
jgi:predicted ribosomally synthesized peptide with nif11-like leader